MNVMFDHQVFSLQKYGGISRYFNELSDGFLNVHDVKANIFSPFYINEYLDNNQAVKHRGIKFSTSSIFGKAAIATANTLLTYSLKKYSKKIDIFHETYYSMLDCSPLRSRRVVTVHDMIYEKLSGESARGRFMLSIKARAIRKADHIICVSENTKNDLVELLGVPENKISVVYHGCNFSRYLNVDANPVFDCYLLYVGKRDGYKNFDFFLDLFAEKKSLNERFKIVCFGGGGFSKQELSKFDALGIKKGMIVYCEGDNTMLARLYKNASAFIYPSLYEGFGMPVLEAMSLGCPVLCSNAGSLPEVVGDAAELFDPNDSDSLLVAIQNVVFSKNRSETLIYLGFQRANIFTWEKCVNSTLDVYRAVL